MFVDELSKSIQPGKQTDLIPLDFSKALDQVDHEKIIIKTPLLRHKGEHSKLDFLDNRTQSVILKGSTSHNITVSSGVPQGSVFEPILFLAYINDLLEQVRSRVRLFADGTAMYLALDNQADLEILQKDLEILENWEKLWDMSFNLFKCQVFHVTRLKIPLQTKYHLHGCVHESVPSAKYLGSLYQKTSNGPNTSTTLPKRQIKH